MADLDCFSTTSSNLIGFPKYEPCSNLSQIFPEDTTLICLSFSIPTLDNFFNTVGISYGFTMIIFSIIRFIMTLNAGPKASKIITIASVTVISLLIVIMIFLIAFVKSFTAWLTNSFINYIIQFMIIISIIVALVIFGLMNRKLAKINDPFHDGDLVYFIRKKD